MSSAPALPLSVEEYLSTSYPDGDLEYLDGVLGVRNLGTPSHSLLQKTLIVHLAGYEREAGFEVLPECRTRISVSRYRIPDVLAVAKPYRRDDRVLEDTPFLVLEILSPDDRMRDSLIRFREYESIGVTNIVQMDPEERTTHLLLQGDLVRRDLSSVEGPGGRLIPFDTRTLLEAAQS